MELKDQQDDGHAENKLMAAIASRFVLRAKGHHFLTGYMEEAITDAMDAIVMAHSFKPGSRILFPGFEDDTQAADKRSFGGSSAQPVRAAALQLPRASNQAGSKPSRELGQTHRFESPGATMQLGAPSLTMSHIDVPADQVEIRSPLADAEVKQANLGKDAEAFWEDTSQKCAGEMRTVLQWLAVCGFIVLTVCITLRASIPGSSAYRLLFILSAPSWGVFYVLYRARQTSPAVALLRAIHSELHASSDVYECEKLSHLHDTCLAVLVAIFTNWSLLSDQICPLHGSLSTGIDCLLIALSVGFTGLLIRWHTHRSRYLQTRIIWIMRRTFQEFEAEVPLMSTKMNGTDLREEINQRLHKPAQPPIGNVRRALSYCSLCSMDTVRDYTEPVLPRLYDSNVRPKYELR